MTEEPEARMGKLVLYTLVSLDGATEDPHRYFPETPEYVGPPIVDEDIARHEEALLARTAAVLLGRTTYDQWSRFWPTSSDEFAGFINNVKKYVVTSSPLTGDWPNAEAVSGPLADIVRDVKAATDGDVCVHASITLAKALLAAGLVDELCLSVGRVIDPAGPRLFDEVPDRVVMTLLEAAPTSSGSVWLRYAMDTAPH
ncbi:dihydrofolate reductase family protein [Nocardioides islandensis]|uniref:Dihydrofolate reductase family protein n=1 Tax=Nocardioides islandensis TaxID=433663 RepID=A0A930VA19_9ACTN|nr:dihydrofolate reductase family protein [Nocardioides islandensis]MBF4763674.1 dihydrofolate reductase family protein [Nocardioides islandensis]